MADQTYQQQPMPGEGDPMSRKISTSGETDGYSPIKNFDNMEDVPFAGDEPGGTDIDYFAKMQEAQNAAASGDIPKVVDGVQTTSETDPTAKENMNGDDVEGIKYTGKGIMGQNFDNAMQIKGAGGVRLEDMTAGMSNHEREQSLYEEREEIGAQLRQSQEKLSQEANGPTATGEPQASEPQEAYELTKTEGIVLNGTDANITRKISTAATGQTVDFSEEKEKLEQAQKLGTLAEGKMTASGGNTNEAISGLANFTTEARTKIEELKENIAEAEELQNKITDPGKDVANGAKDPSVSIGESATQEAMAEGAAPAANINEAMANMRKAAATPENSASTNQGPIDFSETYKTPVSSGTPTVNPGQKAKDREQNALKTSISSEISSHGNKTEMNNTWGQSPEKMPTATQANLTPEQQEEALRRAAGEQKPAA